MHFQILIHMKILTLLSNVWTSGWRHGKIQTFIIHHCVLSNQSRAFSILSPINIRFGRRTSIRNASHCSGLHFERIIYDFCSFSSSSFFFNVDFWLNFYLLIFSWGLYTFFRQFSRMTYMNRLLYNVKMATDIYTKCIACRAFVLAEWNSCEKFLRKNIELRRAAREREKDLWCQVQRMDGIKNTTQQHW